MHTGSPRVITIPVLPELCIHCYGGCVTRVGATRYGDCAAPVSNSVPSVRYRSTCVMHLSISVLSLLLIEMTGQILYPSASASVTVVTCRASTCPQSTCPLDPLAVFVSVDAFESKQVRSLRCASLHLHTPRAMLEWQVARIVRRPEQQVAWTGVGEGHFDRMSARDLTGPKVKVA